MNTLPSTANPPTYLLLCCLFATNNIVACDTSQQFNDGRFRSAQYHRNKGNIDEAINLFTAAGRDGHLKSIEALIKLGEPFEDQRPAQEILSEPLDKEAVITWAVLELEDGKFKTGIVLLEALEKRYPNDPEMKFNLAFGYETTNQIAKAIEKYKEAAKLGLPEAFWGLGTLLIKQKEIEEGLKYFERAGKRGCPEGYRNIGVYYFENGDYEKASTWFQKAVDLDPELLREQRQAGLNLYEQKKYKDALRFLDHKANIGNISKHRGCWADIAFCYGRVALEESDNKQKEFAKKAIEYIEKVFDWGLNWIDKAPDEVSVIQQMYTLVGDPEGVDKWRSKFAKSKERANLCLSLMRSTRRECNSLP